MTTVSQIIGVQELQEGVQELQKGATSQKTNAKKCSTSVSPPGKVVEGVSEDKVEEHGSSNSKSSGKKRRASTTVAEEIFNRAKEEETTVKVKMQMNTNEEIGGVSEGSRISSGRKKSGAQGNVNAEMGDSKRPKVLKVDLNENRGAKSTGVRGARGEARSSIEGSTCFPSPRSRQKASESLGSPNPNSPLASPTRSKSLASPIPSKRSRNSSSSDGSVKAIEKRTKSIDNNDSEDMIREKSVSMLKKAIGEGEDVGALAKAVEDAVFNEFKSANDHRYRSRIRSRVSNLNRNRAIGYQLMKGNIKPERFAKMSADELATRELKELREELESSIDQHLLPEREVVGTENTKRSDNAV